MDVTPKPNPYGEYKKQWLGVCVDPHTAMNLRAGQIYLLKDRTGDKQHFFVSNFITNTNCFFGAYNHRCFEVFEDVTELVESLPKTKANHTDIELRALHMVSNVRGLTLQEAQTQLIEQKILPHKIIDESNNPLKEYPTIPLKGPLTIEEIRENTREVRKDPEPVKTEVTKPQDVTPEPVKPKVEKPKVEKPKAPAKPKLVQKGLFG